MKMFFKINRNGVSKVYYIAIDIGGTQIKSAVIDKQLNMFDYQQIPTPDNKSELITDKVYEIVTGYMKQYQLIQPVIGISLAGVVDEQKGEIVYAGPTIPNYKGTNFKRLLKSLSPYVKVKNDVNAALLGELKLHQYQAERIFCMTLGTGIGGAYKNNQGHIDNGELHKANEVGYLLYRPTENTTFEQRAATSALKKRMIDGGFTRSTHVPVLFEAAEEGDDIAKQILNEWAEDVAEGIAQIQVMYDPGLILIGGGISEQGDNLIKYIEPKVAHYLPKDYVYAPIQTTKSKNDAALYGCLQ